MGHDVGVLRRSHTLGPLRRPTGSGAKTHRAEKKEENVGERLKGDWQREEGWCGWCRGAAAAGGC